MITRRKTAVSTTSHTKQASQVVATRRQVVEAVGGEARSPSASKVSMPEAIAKIAVAPSNAPITWAAM